MSVLVVMAAHMGWATFVHAEGVGPSEDHNTQTVAQSETTVSSTAPLSLPVRIIRDNDQVASEKKQQIEAADREKYDLVAQQSVAKSTIKLVELTESAWNLALAQTVIAGIGALAVAITIILTFRATNAAVKATEIAQGAERPWIVASRSEARLLPQGVTVRLPGQQPQTYTQGIELRIAWVNAGRSPAIRMKSAIQRQTIANGAPIPLFTVPAPASSTGVLGPAIEFFSMVHFGASEISNAYLNGDRHFVYGTVEYYSTHSNQKFITEYCIELKSTGNTLQHSNLSWPETQTMIADAQNDVR
ncbi:hypothetical protein [Aureimonas sp. ME7]|uniref:hypothetical protein n=1 Tax=Aureimonas sp. ME7 TaxID=2744252 RepID=UPI0015F746A7|nr:hypothetical protein [Aureimonas sp. ME7]